MSEDPTKPQADEKFDTTPGVTAILERINQVRDELSQNDSQIMAKLTEIETRVKELEAQGRLTNHKFDILLKEIFEYKAQVRDTQARVDELERKAS
ncbi:MAG: hypothetical protein ACJ74G_21965 [Blastocatellia bacterium]